MNTKTNKSKHDPCRKFKRGDTVRVVENNGRKTPTSIIIEDLYEKTLTVIGNEDDDNDVLVRTSQGDRFIQFSFLELVTPVEEMDLYSVEECGFAKAVYLKKKGKTCYTIPYGEHSCWCDTRAEALAAAEAECARLNATRYNPQ